MTYITGSIAAVPKANRQKYIDHVRAVWDVFQSKGALRMVEAWGVDIQKGKVTDFFGAVDAREDEVIVFSWIEWPDKDTANAVWQTGPDDPAMQSVPEMPFDGNRMIFGGFAPIFSAGTDRGAGYIQGFALAVPEGNKDAYITMAREAWDAAFAPKGALGITETWGADVPRGEKTDFYRAAKAEPGEVPVFSWNAWPDRETCDAAARAMEAETEGQDFPDMPFDGMRMIWGGFEPIFDSDAK